jgi:FkbM family methyltransferase
VWDDFLVIGNRLRTLSARGVKLTRILAQPDYRRPLRHGVAAAVEHEHITLPFTPKTVLDVGANRGQFGLIAAHRWPQADLICFEPLPAAIGVLRQVLPGSKAEVRNVALSDAPGEVDLHISKADDSSSLLPIGKAQAAAFPGTEEVGVVTVRAARLDAEIDAADPKRPVLLKIDVQGGELQVLRGATGLLPHIDAVLVECSFVELYEGQPLAHEIVSFLAEHGLQLYGAGAPSSGSNGRVVQIDLVFARTAA